MNTVVQELMDEGFSRTEAIEELRLLRQIAAETMDPEATLLEAGIIPTEENLIALKP
jgi:hypothetical protein